MYEKRPLCIQVCSKDINVFFSSISLMFEVSNLSVNSSFYQRTLSFSFKQKIDMQKKYTFRRRKMYTS